MSKYPSPVLYTFQKRTSPDREFAENPVIAVIEPANAVIAFGAFPCVQGA